MGKKNNLLSVMLELWPGHKGLGRKKHRPGEPFSQTLRSTSAGGGGPWGDPPVRPYRDSIQGFNSGAVAARSTK